MAVRRPREGGHATGNVQPAELPGNADRRSPAAAGPADRERDGELPAQR